MALLSKNEASLWGSWKRASELLRARIVEEISAETGLSDPDFGVLTRVVEDGGGAMRQNHLAESMGYHRSRLSHHVSRMEERGLVTRRQSGDGVEVVVTDEGRELVALARPIHAAAVRRYLLDPLTTDEQRALGVVLDKLISPKDPNR
ncbi:MAG TPA: MarR family transcriptional regulator [Streptosporangiaceae bacterium]|nr:MarR family transcriptional regulator [Streptosporangiaceae bacterium]